MTEQWIAPDRLFDGHAISDGLAVRVLAGQVVEIGPAPATARRMRGLLTPGFVDLQVNGGGGVMVNDTPTPEGLRAIAAAHRHYGTVAIMATVITDAPEVLDHAAAAVTGAKDAILGLHIEGPHIAAAKRGTHAAAFIRPMDDRTMDVVAKLRKNDVPVIITVAPEAATQDQIAQLAAMGAIVSIGHTNATAEQAEAMIAAGASCATHLFNAMSQMTGREPGVAGAVIESGIYSGLICDGHHVDDRMIRLALRARPVPDRVFLVSDAMATVGGPDSFQLYGDRVKLDDGRLINADGNLAGAHVTQAAGLKRLIEVIGRSPAQALRMVTSIPAAAIGHPELGQVRGRAAQDILLLNEDYDVKGTLAGVLSSPTNGP